MPYNVSPLKPTSTKLGPKMENSEDMKMQVAMWLRHTHWLDSPGLRAGPVGDGDLRFIVRALETWSSRSEAVYFMILQS